MPKKSPKQKTSIVLSAKAARSLRLIAKARGITKSAMIERLISLYGSGMDDGD